MIIECVNCNKIFEVKSELIPSNGRTIQCGSCHHIWFYKHNDILKIYSSDNENTIKNTKPKDREKTKLDEKILSKKIDKIINKKDNALIKYQEKSKLTIFNFFGYIVVAIISLIAVIILLDTFKLQLSTLFPDLELVLYNLYETIKDIYLFFNDLIK